jgi:hypothetical protein
LFSGEAGLFNGFCDLTHGELFSDAAGLVNGFSDVADGKLFSGTAGFVNWFCDVADGELFSVKAVFVNGFCDVAGVELFSGTAGLVNGFFYVEDRCYLSFRARASCRLGRHLNISARTEFRASYTLGQPQPQPFKYLSLNIFREFSLILSTTLGVFPLSCSE